MSDPAIYPKIALADIVVNREQRQRRLVDDGLADSMRKRGLIHPIVLTAGNVLVAGERRLEAAKALGWKDIEFRMFSDLSPVEAEIIELEENIKRKDLDWQDNVRAVQAIHSRYRALDPAWTMAETADAISLSIGSVSKYIRVAKDMATNERVAAASGVMEAWNIICRLDSRAEAEGFDELLVDYTNPVVAAEAAKVLEATGSLPSAPPKPVPVAARPDPVLQTNFLDWAPTYEGMKFNLIHCDFPYGIEVFSGPQARGAEPSQIPYKDDPELFKSLVECLCRETDRLASQSCHLMFWCRLDAGKMEALIRQTFQKLAPSWQFYKFPLIWVKSDNAGIAAEPRFWPRHIYETCLLASRGRRQIVKVVGDAYSAPSDRSLHPSTKPEPMLRHFMSMLVDDQSSVLDPTAGSGAALRAAESLGARSILGLEIDPGFADSANREIRKQRALRGASQQVRGAVA